MYDTSSLEAKPEGELKVAISTGPSSIPSSSNFPAITDKSLVLPFNSYKQWLPRSEQTILSPSSQRPDGELFSLVSIISLGVRLNGAGVRRFFSGVKEFQKTQG